MALKDELTLEENEEDGAIFFCVSNSTPRGKPRSMTIARSRDIQEKVNPSVIKMERIRLASYDVESPSDVTAANQLAIKEETTRHSFDDGYWMFEFHYRRGTIPDKVRVSEPTWKATNQNSRIILHYYDPTGSSNNTFIHVWRNNANTFRIFVQRGGSTTSQNQGNTNGYLEAIYGIRLHIEREKQNG